MKNYYTVPFHYQEQSHYQPTRFLDGTFFFFFYKPLVQNNKNGMFWKKQRKFLLLIIFNQSEDWSVAIFKCDLESSRKATIWFNHYLWLSSEWIGKRDWCDRWSYLSAESKERMLYFEIPHGQHKTHDNIWKLQTVHFLNSSSETTNKQIKPSLIT